MRRQRLIVQMGIGVADTATEAACRAVQEALSRGTVHLQTPPAEMVIRLGAPEPGAIDTARVAALCPGARLRVDPVSGGLAPAGPEGPVLVAAAVEHFFTAR